MIGEALAAGTSASVAGSPDLDLHGGAFSPTLGQALATDTLAATGGIPGLSLVDGEALSTFSGSAIVDEAPGSSRFLTGALPADFGLAQVSSTRIVAADLSAATAVFAQRP